MLRTAYNCIFTLYYVTGTLIYKYNVLRTGHSMQLGTIQEFVYPFPWYFTHHVFLPKANQLFDLFTPTAVRVRSRTDLFEVVCRRDSKYILLPPIFVWQEGECLEIYAVVKTKIS
jgi:hypothetical protein